MRLFVNDAPEEGAAARRRRLAAARAGEAAWSSLRPDKPDLLAADGSRGAETASEQEVPVAATNPALQRLREGLGLPSGPDSDQERAARLRLRLQRLFPGMDSARGKAVAQPGPEDAGGDDSWRTLRGRRLQQGSSATLSTRDLPTRLLAEPSFAAAALAGRYLGAAEPGLSLVRSWFLAAAWLKEVLSLQHPACLPSAQFLLGG